MAKKGEPTLYNKLQKAASNYCEKPSKTNASRLTNAQKRYEADAAKKGKSKADISKTVSKVKKCKKK